jgi:hypothetical protein
MYPRYGETSAVIQHLNMLNPLSTLSREDRLISDIALLGGAQLGG